MLIDNYKRRIRKLRVSLLDACNFRCFYCMPQNPQFMKPDRYMSVQEIQRIASVLVGLGVEQIRITGGEPLMRREFREIVQRLSDLPLQKLGLTTNAFYLDRELSFLRETSCRNLNVSLDSLDENGFAKITRANNFDRVISAILRAKGMGFNVKINTVLMRGINDHEVENFIQFSSDNDIEVRFLEVMKIGQARNSQRDLFISAGEVIQQLEINHRLDVQNVEKDSTSFNYVSKEGAKIGFIASESRPFCGNCSRWRLSAKGLLRACLMSEEGVNVKDVASERLEETVRKLLPMKPFQRIEQVAQDMNQIGG